MDGVSFCAVNRENEAGTANTPIAFCAIISTSIEVTASAAVVTVNAAFFCQLFGNSEQLNCKFVSSLQNTTFILHNLISTPSSRACKASNPVNVRLFTIPSTERKVITRVSFSNILLPISKSVSKNVSIYSML